MFQQNILSSFIFGLKIKVFRFAMCRYIVLDMWLVSLPEEIPFTTSFLPVVSPSFCPHPVGLGPISHFSLLDSSPCFLSHSQVEQPNTQSFQFFWLLLYLNGTLYYTHCTLRPSFASWPVWKNLRCWVDPLAEQPSVSLLRSPWHVNEQGKTDFISHLYLPFSHACCLRFPSPK